MKVCEAPLIEALQSEALQRLKHIDQHGMARYFGDKTKPFSRYDHSLGVFYLVRKAGASLNEQVAALYHDASHTVFSHTGDHVFQKQGEYHHDKSYQDHIHLWFLDKMDVVKRMKSLGITRNDLDPDKPSYTALEQPYPDMCADRIQYNLQTGYLFDRITKPEIMEILNDLKFENGKWFFKDKALAEKFADLSLYFTEHFWSSSWNEALNHWGAAALKRALALGLLQEHEIHFGKDVEVLAKLKRSNDPDIRAALRKLENPKAFYDVVAPGKGNYSRVPKFRGIDPLILLPHGQLVRLSDVNKSFKRRYKDVKQRMKKGLHIHFY